MAYSKTPSATCAPIGTNCGVYKISNIIDNRVYIGSSSELSVRRYRHFREFNKNKHHSLPIREFVKKYGFMCLNFEVVEFCSSGNLIERETAWIKYYDSINKGFNTRFPKEKGGMSDDVRQKIREKRLNFHGNTLIKTIYKGETIFEGTVTETNIRFNIAESSINRAISKNIKSKGFIFEKIEKKSDMCYKNCIIPITNKELGLVRVICVETGQIFNSIKECGEAFGVNPSSINNVCRGKQEKFSGYVFKYVDKPDMPKRWKKIKIVCGDGREWDSIMAAVRETGISEYKIGEACRGKRETVNNLTFKRIII